MQPPNHFLWNRAAAFSVPSLPILGAIILTVLHQSFWLAKKSCLCMAGDELIIMRLRLSCRLSVTTFSTWLAKKKSSTRLAGLAK